MAVGPIPLAKAQQYANSLPPGELQRRIQGDIDAARKGGESTVILPWLSATDESALGIFLQQNLRTDGFAAGGTAPPKPSVFAAGTTPPVAALVERAVKLGKQPIPPGQEATGRQLRQSVIDEAKGMLKQPGLPALDKARLNLAIAGLDKGIADTLGYGSKVRYGQEAINAVREAVRLAPDDPVAAMIALHSSYAFKVRTDGFTHKAQKWAVESGFGLNKHNDDLPGFSFHVDSEAKAALANAAKFKVGPNPTATDAEVQYGRMLLAGKLGDKTAEAEAKAAVEQIRATNPALIAEAKLEYDKTVHAANQIKTDDK